MKTKEQKVKITPVKFLKFQDGSIIAFFPDSSDGKNVVSYEHIGQHAPSTVALMHLLEKATIDEYSALKRELDSIYGPSLTVIE